MIDGSTKAKKLISPLNCRSMCALNQTASLEGLSARIRFARANSIFSLAVCFRRPRYRVFRYPNCPFMTANTCSTLALTDDLSCSLLLICPLERLELFLYCDGLRLILYRIFLPFLLRTTVSSRFSAPKYPLSPLTVSSSPVSNFGVTSTSCTLAAVTSTL